MSAARAASPTSVPALLIRNLDIFPAVCDLHQHLGDAADRPSRFAATTNSADANITRMTSAPTIRVDPGRAIGLAHRGRRKVVRALVGAESPSAPACRRLSPAAAPRATEEARSANPPRASAYRRCTCNAADRSASRRSACGASGSRIMPRDSCNSRTALLSAPKMRLSSVSSLRTNRLQDIEPACMNSALAC